MVITIISGCASTPLASVEEDQLRKEFSTPEEGMAGIYIYRPSIFIGDAVTREIKLDGNFIGKLKVNTYLYQEVSSGEHILATESSIDFNEIKTIFNPGENYFFKQAYSLGVPFMGAATNLNKVSVESGKKEILKSRLVVEPVNN